LIVDDNKDGLESRFHPLWEADGPGITVNEGDEAGKPNNCFNLTALLSRFVLFAIAHGRTNRATMTLQGLSVCYIYLMPCGEVIHGKKITYTAKRTDVVKYLRFTRKSKFICSMGKLW